MYIQVHPDVDTTSRLRQPTGEDWLSLGAHLHVSHSTVRHVSCGELLVLVISDLGTSRVWHSGIVAFRR